MPRMSGAGGDVIRVAVLRDYPLRLWAEQTEHFEGLLREFSLLLIGERSAELHTAAPGRLVELADLFASRFGGLLQTINDERRAALDSGADRMDSRVLLPAEAPVLLDRVRTVLEETDEFLPGRRAADASEAAAPDALRHLDGHRAGRPVRRRRADPVARAVLTAGRRRPDRRRRRP